MRKKIIRLLLISTIIIGLVLATFYIYYARPKADEIISSSILNGYFTDINGNGVAGNLQLINQNKKITIKTSEDGKFTSNEQVPSGYYEIVFLSDLGNIYMPYFSERTKYIDSSKEQFLTGWIASKHNNNLTWNGVGPDISINFDSQLDLSNFSDEIELNFSVITQNDSADNVGFYYRVDGEQNWKLSDLGGGPKDFSSFIAITELDGKRYFDYFISAQDGFGNTVRYPDDGLTNPSKINFANPIILTPPTLILTSPTQNQVFTKTGTCPSCTTTIPFSGTAYAGGPSDGTTPLITSVEIKFESGSTVAILSPPTNPRVNSWNFSYNLTVGNPLSTLSLKIVAINSKGQTWDSGMITVQAR